MQDNSNSFSYWRRPRVRKETGLSDSTIWRMEKANKFPKRYRLSSNIIAWRSDQIQDWMRSRLTADGEEI